MRARGNLAIDIVIDHITLGGSEIQTLRLAERLSMRGHRVRVTSLMPRPSHPLKEELAAMAAGVNLDVPNGCWGRHWTTMLPSYIRDQRAHKPDIVYAVLTRSQAVAGLAKAINPSTPLVLARRFTSTQVQGIRRLVRDAPLIVCDAVVANNTLALSDPRSRRFLGDAIAEVIPNYLPAEAFLPAQPVGQYDAPVIASVANLREVKGHKHLIDAVAHLRSAGQPLTLLLAGDGPLRADLERRARSLKVPAVFLGHVDDVPAVLAASSVFVQASLSEGYPNALLEAMAQGAAIVATDAGDTRLMLNGAGLVVPPGDSLSMAAAIGTLIRNQALQQALRNSARSRARELSNADPTEQWEELFLRLAGRSTARWCPSRRA